VRDGAGRRSEKKGEGEKASRAQTLVSLAAAANAEKKRKLTPSFTMADEDDYGGDAG
jgi:hypothetical protein